MDSIGNYFRTASIIRKLLPLLPEGRAQLLDIGAGSCHIARTLSRKHGYDVTAVDVVDHNGTDFPLDQYDGKTLPYADKSFDIGVLIFVLHHAPDMQQLIREAGRVCKELIIVEDLPGNKVERLLWQKLDYQLNHAKHGDIAVAHEAMSVDKWQLWFESQGFGVVQTQKFRSLFTTGGAYPHVAFKLLPI